VLDTAHQASLTAWRGGKDLGGAHARSQASPVPRPSSNYPRHRVEASPAIFPRRGLAGHLSSSGSRARCNLPSLPQRINIQKSPGAETIQLLLRDGGRSGRERSPALLPRPRGQVLPARSPPAPASRPQQPHISKGRHKVAKLQDRANLSGPAAYCGPTGRAWMTSTWPRAQSYGIGLGHVSELTCSITGC